MSGLFKAGGPGGPGRPKGSRNKLAEDFVRDLREAWEKHGKGVLEHLALDDPAKLADIVAKVIPRDINLSVEHSVADLTDADLALIAAGGGEGVAASSGGAEVPAGLH